MKGVSLALRFQFAYVMTYFVGEELVGVRQYWDRERTQLHSEELLKAGKKHGVQREWHKNGQLKVEYPYKDGQMHGTFKQWNEKGKLLGSFVMTEGSGTFQTWYPNGQIHDTIPYTKGKYNGEMRKYYDTGKLFQVITYKETWLTGSPTFGSVTETFGRITPNSTLKATKLQKEEYLKAAEKEKSLPPIKS